MAKEKKSWQEKLRDSKGLPMVEPIPIRMARTLGVGTLCIPAPLEVDAEMRSIPEGRLITFNQIRARLAHKHGATVA
jgi:hypothetical protein